jgi:hypothetical protein
MFTLQAPITKAGVVLSQPHKQHDTIQRVGTDGFFHIHTHKIAEQHGGGFHQRFAKRHYRKLQRKAAGFVHATLYRFGQFAEVCIARR